MAGDWMKIELELPDKPEIHGIAGILNLDPDCVVGKLIRVWQWFDKHTTDGNAYGVTFALPDRISGVTGFGEAMSFVGWLEQKDKVLHMPGFDKHTSASAKQRAQTAKRVAKSKSNCANAQGNAHTVTKALPTALPREEKRREESKPLCASDDACDGFDEFWQAYPRKIAKASALKSWRKIRPDAELSETVMDALAKQKDSDAWKRDGGKFIPHPATWLNGRRWEDEIDDGGGPSADFLAQFEGIG